MVDVCDVMHMGDHTTSAKGNLLDQGILRYLGIATAPLGHTKVSSIPSSNCPSSPLPVQWRGGKHQRQPIRQRDDQSAAFRGVGSIIVARSCMHQEERAVRQSEQEER